jgi:hypothetical protein
VIPIRTAVESAKWFYSRGFPSIEFGVIISSETVFFEE